MAGYDRVALYESMGRHAGWLTAASCLGKVDEIDPPHLVYLPEVAFSEERFLDDVSRCFVKFGFATVAVAEMLKTAEGEIVGLLRGYCELRFPSVTSLSRGVPTTWRGVCGNGWG